MYPYSNRHHRHHLPSSSSSSSSSSPLSSPSRSKLWSRPFPLRPCHPFHHPVMVFHSNLHEHHPRPPKTLPMARSRRVAFLRFQDRKSTRLNSSHEWIS